VFGFLSESPTGCRAAPRAECVLATQVVDVAGGNQRHLLRPGQLDQRRVDPLLHIEAGVLQLDVDVVAPKSGRAGRARPRRRRAGSPRAPCRHAPRGSRRERSSPWRSAPASSQSTRGGSSSPPDSRARIPDQVAVALGRGSEHGQVRVALLLNATVVADVQLEPMTGRTPACGLAVKFDRSGQRAMVGERDRRISIPPPAP